MHQCTLIYTWPFTFVSISIPSPSTPAFRFPAILLALRVLPSQSQRRALPPYQRHAVRCEIITAAGTTERRCAVRRFVLPRDDVSLIHSAHIVLPFPAGAKKKNKKKKSAAAKANAAQAAATSPTEATAPAPASTDEPEPGPETQNGAADHTYDGDVKDEPSAGDAPVDDAPVVGSFPSHPLLLSTHYCYWPGPCGIAIAPPLKATHSHLARAISPFHLLTIIGRSRSPTPTQTLQQPQHLQAQKRRRARR